MATKTNSPKIDNTKISYGLEATRASIARNIAWATADIEEARQRLCEDFVGHFDREAERAYTSQLLLQHLTELSDDLAIATNDTEAVGAILATIEGLEGMLLMDTPFKWSSATPAMALADRWEYETARRFRTWCLGYVQDYFFTDEE